MKNHPIVLAIIWVTIIMSTTGGLFCRIPIPERSALEALFNQTNGRNWPHQKNWKQARGTENTWQGITCDAANTTVLKIELPGNQLQGVLPVDLQVFAHLTTLDLSNNRLSGEIPRLIESFKSLKKLDLSNNDFSGPIPAWLGSLKNLEELVLDNNRLEGAIPKELANLENLKVLRLAGNRLSGEFPAELVQLVNLEDNRCDFKWNGFSAADTGLKEFLREKQMGGDWESTQTTAPSGIEVAESTEDTIIICWLPIPFTVDSGGYRVYYREEGLPYEDKTVEEVIGKTVVDVSLKGLKKGTKYHFKIRTWTGIHSNNKNRIDSPFSDEMSTATRGIIISGTIRNKDGEGVPGVQIKASNGGVSAETDKDGNYQLSVVPGWSGTVTPSKEGLKFFPISRDYDREVTENTSGNDYSVEPGKVISGIVTYKGQGIGSVLLKFMGDSGEIYSISTNENGNYKQEVPYDWSGTVTPFKERHGFEPEERKYMNVTYSLDEQNYDIRFPKISGMVKNLKGKGIGGIKLNFSYDDNNKKKKKKKDKNKVEYKDKFDYLKNYAYTDDEGNYENDVLKNWKGRVTPEPFPKSRYFFQPYSREIDRIWDAKKLDFKAWRYYKYFLQITGNLMRYDDSEYSFYDGSTIFSPEITLGFHAIKGCYIFSSVEFISRRLNYWRRHWVWLKQLYSIGIAIYVEDKRSYFRHMKPYFRGSIDFGVTYMGYRESNFENEIQSTDWGKFLGINLFYNYNDRLFSSIKFRYWVTDRFSGYKFGVSLLGYRF